MTNYSQLTIYDRFGRPLTDIEAPTVRSWDVNRVGRCEFTISLNDSRCTEKNLLYRNLVLVQSEHLPDWGGFIWTTRKWQGGGHVIVTANTADALLKFRIVGPGWGWDGDIFWHTVHSASLLFGDDMRITAESVVKRVYSAYPNYIGNNIGTSYDLLQSLISWSGGEYWFYPRIDRGGSLYFGGVWTDGLGQAINGLALEEGRHFEQPDGSYVIEQGQLANRISLTREGSDGVVYIAQDLESQAKYGVIEGLITGVPNRINIVTYGDTAVKYRAEPTKTLVINALNEPIGAGTVFDYLRLGNTIWINGVRAGFSGGSVGMSLQARIMGMAYDDRTGKVMLALEEIR